MARMNTGRDDLPVAPACLSSLPDACLRVEGKRRVSN